MCSTRPDKWNGKDGKQLDKHRNEWKEMEWNGSSDIDPRPLHLIDSRKQVIVFNQRGKEPMRRMTGLNMEEGQNLFEVLPAFRQKS